MKKDVKKTYIANSKTLINIYGVVLENESSLELDDYILKCDNCIRDNVIDIQPHEIFKA